MVSIGNAASDLSKTIDEALDLLQDYAQPQEALNSVEPLSSLFEQCAQLLEKSETERLEPLRTVHHFACTGGTLISKCISALPNIVLLSEIDPLSWQYKNTDKKQYSPTDITLHLRNGLRGGDDAIVAELFVANISNLHENLKLSGRRLVIRDHTHSHYCSLVVPEDRPSLQEILKNKIPLKSVVTVRHPLDSYISLIENRWKHFSPFSLEEYSRRYILFLDEYVHSPIIYYEEFVKFPEDNLQNICNMLDIVYAPDAFDLMDMVVLSGDSGRSSNVIAPRPRREVPESVRLEALDSPTYKKLCKRLKYNPDVDAKLDNIRI